MDKDQSRRFNRIKKEDEEYRRKVSGKQEPKKKKKKRKRPNFRKLLNNRRVGIWRDYGSYCRSKEFKLWKKAVLMRGNYKCSICGVKAIIAHHLIYKKWGTEKVTDGTALCFACHEMIHYDLWAMKQMKVQFD